MKRLGFFLVFPFLTAGLLATMAQADEGADGDKTVKNALFLQQAMAQARHFLLDAQPRKAVDTLEDQLPKVGGNASYLALLREAYRAYITQLWVANQPDLARRYMERLCVLEPGAATDPALRPPVAGEKRMIEKPAPAPEPVASKPIYPKYVRASGDAGKKADVVKKADPDKMEPTFRAYADDSKLDPFDYKFRRIDAESESKAKLAQMLLKRAEEQFAKRKFNEAKSLYEQAIEADGSVLAPSKDRYAYCLLEQVVNELNRPDFNPGNLTALQKQVNGAVHLAPGLGETGKWLLREIELRSKDKTIAGSSEVSVTFDLKHLGKNKEGWNVSETPHFRIFHHQGPELAEKVARIAEGTRATMYRRWFGNDGVEWTPKCELVLHDNGDSYHRMTGVPATSPGHARIESDPTGKRIVSRRMDLRIDHPGFFEAVLPHETTHVVLAGMFEGHAVPRWADEGIAVLSEPEDKVQLHRRKLSESETLGQLFPLKELMELPDYPQPRRIAAFYAQSVAFCEFMTAQKGPLVLTHFIRDGLREGYEASLRRHYGMDLPTLQQRWQEHLTNGPLASR